LEEKLGITLNQPPGFLAFARLPMSKDIWDSELSFEWTLDGRHH